MSLSVVRLSPQQQAQIRAAAYVRQKEDQRAKAQVQRTERAKTVLAFIAYAVLCFLMAGIARHQINTAAAAKMQPSRATGLALYANPTAAIDRQIELATR